MFSAMYRLLFYKGYQSAVRTGNYAGFPVLGGCSPVAICAMLNFFSLFMIAERIFDFEGTRWVRPDYKWGVSFFFMLITLAYFLVGERYKRIITYYEKNYRYRNIPAILVIGSYYILSFLLILLAGMFRNHHGIFK